MAKRKAFPRLAVSLQKRLALLLDRPLTVFVHVNRVEKIRVRRDGSQGLIVRVHRMFVDAPAEVIEHLARYIATEDSGASVALDVFMDEQEVAAGTPGYVGRLHRRLKTKGKAHDLQSLLDSLNERLFCGRIRVRITWGPKLTRKNSHPRQSLKMGSYSVEDRLIRIHPALDRKCVPRFFIEWIIFHEMLHAVHRIPIAGGRRIFHTLEFLDHERAFPDYAKAKYWEKRNLGRLLAW